MSLQNIAKRHGVVVDAASALTPCYGRRGSLHPMFGKKHTDEALKKIGEKINSSRVSQAEHSLTDKLVNKHGGGKNLGVGGWSCDYVHADRKIIVEFFGDFWHHNPDIYDDSWINPFTMRTTAAVRERDQRKIKELQELGYVVIVVWEKEWKSNQESQLKRIDDAFNQL